MSKPKEKPIPKKAITTTQQKARKEQNKELKTDPDSNQPVMRFISEGTMHSSYPVSSSSPVSAGSRVPCPL